MKRFSYLKKAQLSLEMIILLAVVLAMFATFLFVSSQNLSSARSKVYHDQARFAAESITDAADAVYYSGVGSKKTISVIFPDTLQSASVSDGGVTLTLLIRGGRTQPVFDTSQANLSGSLPQVAGRHSITITGVQGGATIS